MRTLIVIPCYNEAANIAQVLTDIQKHCPTADILVVDDGSKDNTSEVAKQYAQVVRLPVNLGIGGSVQTGIKYAAQQGYDFCFQVDGDGQHPADQIALFFEAYNKKPANLIIGSRFIEKGGFKSTTMRRAGISLIRTIASLVTGVTVTDPTSGFRMLDRKAIELFSREYSLDFPEPTSLAIASEAKLSLYEIPVRMKERSGGTSSIMGFKKLSYMIRVSSYLFLIRIRRYCGEVR